MSFASRIAEFEARDYFAFREVLDFCSRRNCDYWEDGSRICVVSKETGYTWVKVSSAFEGESSLDTPHVAVLRALVDDLKRCSFIDDPLTSDLWVSELLGRSAA